MSWKQRANDRRTSVRFDVVGPLRATAASDQYVHIHDLGTGGALVESHWPLPIDSHVRLSLSPARDSQIDARVRHVMSIEPCRYLIGLEFLVQTPALRQTVHELLGTIE
jgi:hypothetical protein